MNCALRIAGQRLRAILAVLLLVVPSQLPARSIAELAALSRGATFEVVLPKLEPAHVTYEKPLPLELLSFTERNDAFWSIGTAFAIAPEVFVSNAHVLVSGVGSPLGRPHLRDAAGQTHEVTEVLKFSLHEDFIVFRARGARASSVLEPGSPSPDIGARVYSVGNALGEGVVVRDGLLTSLTAEEQDGRWKWLRFSAAASPGNSGGPLLDDEGRVLGIVTMRSAGENLNYALPIDRVMAASGNAGSIDMRSSFALPILRPQMVTEFKASLPLPASWKDFSRKLIETSSREYDRTQARMLQAHAADLPPQGRSAKFLATLDRSHALALISQQADDTWGMSTLQDSQTTELADEESLEIGSLGDAFGFIWRGAGTDVAAAWRESKVFMDGLLKGLKLPRMVGPQAIRITSLGPAVREDRHMDRFGRRWVMREWSLGYSDLQVITLALPTPDGHVGLVQVSAASSVAKVVSSLRLMADYVHAGYAGTPAQWSAFLANRDLCPPMLRGMRFDTGSGIEVALAGLDVRIPPDLFALDAESRLNLYTGYASRAGKLLAQPAGVMVEKSPGDETSWVGIWAQPKPSEQAGAELNKRWRQMSARQDGFDGRPDHDPEFKSFWAVSAIGDPESGLQYEVTMTLREGTLVPREVTRRQNALLAGLAFRKE